MRRRIPSPNVPGPQRGGRSGCLGVGVALLIVGALALTVGVLVVKDLYFESVFDGSVDVGGRPELAETQVALRPLDLCRIDYRWGGRIRLDEVATFRSCDGRRGRVELAREARDGALSFYAVRPSRDGRWEIRVHGEDARRADVTASIRRVALEVARQSGAPPAGGRQGAGPKGP